MQLSDYFSRKQIIKNGSFEALGLSNSDPGVHFLSFLDDNKFLSELSNNNFISGIICKQEMVNYFKNKNLGIVVSNNPRRDYFKLHNLLAKDKDYNPTLCENQIGTSCRISPKASLSDSGVIIGNNVVIEDFVRIKGPCLIGDNCIIHSGALIGGEGFEFKRYQDNVLDIAHCGNVHIGSNVIIWENATIHKAVYPWDSTMVGEWVRIGAHSHIDHGAKIRDYVEICARCTISGRVDIGEHAFLGPGVIVSNRIAIGKKSKILLGSIVTKNVDEGQVVSGNFAIDHDKHLLSVKTSSGNI